MQSETLFLGVAVVVIAATAGLVVTNRRPRSRWSTLFLAVAVAGIAVLLIAGAGLVISVLTSAPSD